MVGPAARRRREAELRRLIAASNAARERMGGTVHRLRAEVRDPYGIRTAITSHPYVTAGVATGAGVVVVRLLTRRTSEKPGAPTRAEQCVWKLLEGAFAVLRPLGEAWLKRAVVELGVSATAAPKATPASAEPREGATTPAAA